MALNPQTRSLLFGGLLPVVIYTLAEETLGITWGLVIGMVVSLGEVVWEKVRQGRVDGLTWGGFVLITGLGGISLLTQDGVWFRMQPALLEGAMAVLLVGSVALGRPLMVALARKQGMQKNLPPEVVPLVEGRLKGLTLRVGLFFAVHAGLAAWAALYWSTRAWALLKGVGFTLSFLAYLAIEVLLMRRVAARP